MHNEGIIDIIKIKNEGPSSEEIGTLKARFVRYPGSQQLSLWLPQSAWNGYSKYKIINLSTNEVVDENDVNQRVNGTILMTWDTLEIPAGNYSIEIDHPKNGKHLLYFNKLNENEKVPKDKIVEMPVATSDCPSIYEEIVYRPSYSDTKNESLWRVYTDGFGNPISNDDSTIRDRLQDESHHLLFPKPAKDNPKIEYESLGRGGHIFYIENDIRIKLWWEFGGGDCHVFINIPIEKNWELETKTNLSRRREILLFIAQRVRKDQGPSWRFEISENSISFY